ncbi:MAG: sigma-70 family RNA polymerase sigma factor [Akkermansiaceae bacterium]|jgi:RNA polymerase sigma-70 factor (ECF subfamily)|nr:sigma-70 family RNA polymerase sigma factor [Akkermansiaceae bacterium]
MKTQAESDNDLALRWRAGEVEAYNELVRRHLDPVHRFIYSRYGNDHDASDLCQEVFFDVCMKIANFDPAYPFTAWLYTIARRKTVDRYRRMKPVEEYHADLHSGTESRHPGSLLEEQDSARDAWEKVFRLLPENQAMAMWLRVQGQQSIEQIAGTMGQSEANVKVLLFRARQKLAKEWQETPTETR